MRVATQERAGRERLLRYCARPMFAGERLVWAGGGAQVRLRLPWVALQGHRLGQQRCIELRLSAGEFPDRIAALIPPPRKHRQRYFGVLAPNSPCRANHYRLVRHCGATRRLHALLANLALRHENSSRQTAASHLNLK